MLLKQGRHLLKGSVGLQINELSEANKVFKQFLQDPSVQKAQKLSALGEILKEMKVCETTSSLFGKPFSSHMIPKVPCCSPSEEQTSSLQSCQHVTWKQGPRQALSI